MKIVNLKELFRHPDVTDTKMVSALLKAIKENYTEEFDYLKFRQSVKTLSEMDMDEAKSIKGAFATASTMGFTKDKLIKSARHYKNVLNKEKDSFAEALVNQNKSKVEEPLKEVETLGKKIEEYKVKIKQMEKEMEMYNQKITIIKNSIKGAKEKIDGTREKFRVAYTSISSIIDDDITKIETIL